MFLKIFAFAAIFATIQAALIPVLKEQSNSQNQLTANVDEHVDYYAYPKYRFNYGVNDEKSGDYKRHNEERDGKKVTGSYTIVDPDGTIRTVHYTADETGFHAKVEKTGEENKL